MINMMDSASGGAAIFFLVFCIKSSGAALPDGFWLMNTVCQNQDASGFGNTITVPNNDDLKIIDGDVSYLKPANANPLEIPNANGKLRSSDGWTWMGFIEVDNAETCCIVDYRPNTNDATVHMCNHEGNQYIGGKFIVRLNQLPIITNQKVFFAYAFNKADSKVLSVSNKLTQEISVDKTQTPSQNTKLIRLGRQCMATNVYFYSLAYYNQYLTPTQIQEEKKRLQVQTGSNLGNFFTLIKKKMPPTNSIIQVTKTDTDIECHVKCLKKCGCLSIMLTNLTNNEYTCHLSRAYTSDLVTSSDDNQRTYIRGSDL